MWFDKPCSGWSDLCYESHEFAVNYPPPPPLNVGARRAALAAAANAEQPAPRGSTRIGQNRPFTLRCWCAQPLRVSEIAKSPVAAQFRNRCVVETSELVLTERAGTSVNEPLVDKFQLHRNLQ